jgi:hypothetical protein
MSHIGLEPVFLKLSNDLTVHQSKISVTDLFGIDPASPSIFFAFEHNYLPYHRLVEGSLDSADVVISDKSSGELLRGLEIKLTALPDTTTCQFPDDSYGCEIVVRPNTYVLCCSKHRQ